MRANSRSTTLPNIASTAGRMPGAVRNTLSALWAEVIDGKTHYGIAQGHSCRARHLAAHIHIAGTVGSGRLLTLGYLTEIKRGQ